MHIRIYIYIFNYLYVSNVTEFKDGFISLDDGHDEDYDIKQDEGRICFPIISLL